MRNSLAILTHLVGTIETTRGALASRAMPAILRRGLRLLPDELLTYIVELACTSKHLDHLRFSHINRRFHAVVSSHSRLWSCIRSDLRPELMELHISRSKNCDLVIITNHSPFAGACHCPELWAIAVKQSHRWKSVRIEACDKSPRNEFHFPPRMDLPKLSSLALSHDISKILASHPCITWNMPNLHILHVDELFQAMDLSHSKQLKSLLLRTVNGMIVNPGRLLRALHSTAGANLTHLELCFEWSLEQRTDLPDLRVCFDKLKTFVLRLDNTHVSSTAWYTVKSIVQRIDMPNATTVTSTFNIVDDLDGEVVEMWLEWLEGQSKMNRSLKDIFVEVSGYGDDTIEEDVAYDTERTIRKLIKQWVERLWDSRTRPKLHLEMQPEQ